ncbi:MAG: class I SAM-dependent methyltransferase [Candidatus Firestonebacteria bacterium]|nr:class I SAM-dependent methyltransferase [Candidatus Firestonebacteria bacterium]
MDYRERCYGAFVSKHWNFIHVLSREEFDFHAELYAKTYLNHLPADHQAPILDVACGAGHFLYFLKKQGYTNLAGIDISQEQLEIARNMGVTEVQKADMFKFLAKHKGKYALVIANDIVEHLTKNEVIQFLDAILASLRPGGKVIINTENAASLFGSSRVFIDFTHEQGFTPISLSQVLRVCGFEGVRIYPNSPVHSFSSWVRVRLWKVAEGILRAFLAVECGLGKGLKKRDIILEPRIFAVAQKATERA